jgi:hypothetical protein
MAYVIVGYAGIPVATAVALVAGSDARLPRPHWPRPHWPRLSWQVGPAWPGWACARWGCCIARFWDPHHLEEADPHGYAREYGIWMTTEDR